MDILKAFFYDCSYHQHLLANMTKIRYDISRKAGVNMNYLNAEHTEAAFKQIFMSEYFVDKSRMIEKIDEMLDIGERYVCIARPKGFGKTCIASMLGAYYRKGYDSRKLFDHLKVATCRQYGLHQNKHQVIYIDFRKDLNPGRNAMDHIQWVIAKLKDDIKNTYGISMKDASLDRVLEKTKDSFIFILDHWDDILDQDFMCLEDKKAYLRFLRNLLKDQPYVDFAFLTGVVPILKYNGHADLNIFDEYTLMNDSIYDSYFGFHEEEVKKLCADHSNIAYHELKTWYSGYHLYNGENLFHPDSVMEALRDHQCIDFWKETRQWSYFVDCMKQGKITEEDIVQLVSGTLY